MQLDSRNLALSLVMMLGAVLTAQQTTTPSQAAGDNDRAAASSSQSPPLSDTSSQVRIVRLSEITGEVEVDRNTGEGFEPALLNLPIVEGYKLRTAAGFAEVEFEDGSTLRLTPFTAVGFDRLRLQSSSSTVSAVHVQTGTVYVSLARTKGNDFTLSFGEQNVLLMPSSHIRLFLKGQWASVAVLHGKAAVPTSTGVTTVSNRTVNFHLLDPIQVSQNKNAAAPYDGWDEDAVEYHDHNAKKNLYSNTGAVAGIADMNYYGRFVNLGGCGTMWRPYFADAAWDPFANGAWVLYPAWGYAWVSPYPWGWTAYHYGGWNFCPGVGWGWQPLPGQFRTLPIIGKIPPGYRIPQPRPRPRPRGSDVVTAERSPAIESELSPTRLIFRQGSAGLGVPRGNFSLKGASERTQQQGSAKMDIWSTPMIVSSGHGSFALAHVPANTPGRAGSSGGGPSGYFGRPGSYAGGHSGSSFSSGGYSGGHAGSGYSGGGSSSGGGHSSGGGSGGGSRGR